jgi:hypothetical protein
MSMALSASMKLTPSCSPSESALIFDLDLCFPLRETQIRITPRFTRVSHLWGPDGFSDLKRSVLACLRAVGARWRR